MNNSFKFAALFLAATMTTAFSSCSKDDDNVNNGVEETQFLDKTYGTQAMASCESLCDELTAANNVIGRASLTADQETYLKVVLANEVDNVIVPTYTALADAAEDLEKTLTGLDVNTLTQASIDKACEDFKICRQQWERSEAFLGGAASDFSVDPTIDSWPLSRSVLLNYFAGGMKESDLEKDESVLGFHALEFILFRNGKARTVEAFRTNDTYTLFENISGADELKYAQVVAKLLKQRTFQLQVGWEGETAKNASRVKVVKDAGLELTTEKGLSFGDDLKQAGTSSSKYATVKDAVYQVLSADEGSCLAIANEVGTAKIGNPFGKGDISYVESPYSQRSILDFQDNIRSIRNVWYGTTDGSASTSVKSFHNFFVAVNKNEVNTSVINAFNNAINKIGAMPSPFVKYVSLLSGKTFSEEEYEGEE